MEDMRNKVIFGGIYKADPRKICSFIDRIDGYNQHYGLFVPVYDEQTRKVYMVDTYKIGMHCDYENAINKLKQFSEKGSYTFYRAYSGYYYNTSPELTENNFHLFKLLVNLEDYKEVSERDFIEYEDSDKIKNIYLGFEWKYPKGSYLVKKGAKKSLQKTLDYQNYQMLDNCWFHSIWGLDEFKENLKMYEQSETVDVDSLLNYKKTIAKVEKYIECKEEYKKFCQVLDSDERFLDK